MITATRIQKVAYSKNSIIVKEIFLDHISEHHTNAYEIYSEYDSAKHTVIMVKAIESGDHHHHGLTHDERMRFALKGFSNQSKFLDGKSLQHDRLC